MTYYIVLLLLVLSFSQVSSVTVEFEGETPINKKKIVRLAKRVEVSVDSIKTVLINEGYLDAEVMKDESRYLVKAGNLYRVDKVLMRADSTYEIETNIPFNQKALRELFESKLKYSYQSGFYYSSIKILKVIKNNNNYVTLEVNLNQGPRVEIGRKILKGLKRTDKGIVKKYIPVNEGALLNKETIANAEKGALSIPFINYQPPVKIRPRPGYTMADLEFNFLERKQVLVEGGGGYIPDHSTGLVWDLNLKFQNLFGKGKKITLYSERGEKNRQILEINYSQPAYIFGLGDVDLSVATRDYRNQFYEFSLKSGYQTRINQNLLAGVGFGWRSVEPSDNIPSYETFSSNFNIKRNNVDNVLNPSSGFSITWTISYTYRRYANDSLMIMPEKNSFNETHNLLAVNWYKKISNKLVGHIAINYYGFETGESLPPVSELFYIGGPGTIRGYRNEQFIALRSAFGTVEPRLRFNSGYAFAFYDAAYINNRIPDINNNVKTEEFYRYSYGMGLAVIDKNRSVQISLGWNRELSYDQPRLSVEFSSEI